MNKETCLDILHDFNNSTVVLATSAMNNNSSQLIATLKDCIKPMDSYLLIDNSTEEKHLVYYIPYENILMFMEG